MSTITGRDADVIALKEFSLVMDDFHFDMIDETKQLSVTYGEKGKRWIKRMKKLDPFWDANLFVSNLFVQSMQKAISESEDLAKEKQIIEIKNETEEVKIEQ